MGIREPFAWHGLLLRDIGKLPRLARDRTRNPLSFFPTPFLFFTPTRSLSLQTVVVSSVIKVITEQHVMLLTVLKVMNVLFVGVVAYGMYRCMAAPSLNHFFVGDDDLDFYDIYSIVDAGKNFLLMGITW